MSSDFYLAVGNNTLIIRSLDGKTWTQVNRDTTDPISLLNIVPDGPATTWMVSGQPANVAPSGHMLRSIDDAVTWSAELPVSWTYDHQFTAPPPVVQDKYGIPDVWDRNNLGMLWDGNNFHTTGIATSTFHIFSPSGLTASWTKNLIPDLSVTSGYYSFLYSPVTNKYFALFNRIGGGGDGLSHFASSTDMETWTDIATSPGDMFSPYMAQHGSTILVWGLSTDNVNGNMMVSHDGGASWTSHPNNISLNDSGAICVLADTESGLWIVLAFNFASGGSQGIYTSPLTDGVTWTPRMIDSGFSAPILRGICRTQPVTGNLAVTGDSGVFFTCADAGVTWVEVGTQWESRDNLVANKWLFHHNNYYITYQSDHLGNTTMATSPDGLSTDWTSQYTPADPITQFIGPNTEVVANAADTILMMREVTGGRLASPFSRLVGFPSTFFSIRQVYNPLSVSQEDSFIILGLGADGSAYQLFGGTQDGTVTATAVTQPLPTLEDIPGELWDTQKIFRTLYVEAADINNWTISYSVDDPNSAAYKAGNINYPWGPFPLTQRQQVGVNGKQLTIKFVHAVASLVTPQITYIRLDYDIAAGQIQGSQ